MFIKRAIKVISFSVLFSISSTANAGGLQNSMQNFWSDLGGVSNVNGPTAYKGQEAGYYTMGSLYARSPVRQINPVQINLPSFRAGCGGIDLFTGSFSFIDSEKLVQLGKQIASNSTGFAFQLGLETMSPVIAEKIGELQSILNEINNASINSCETAQGLVGSLWPKGDRSSKYICESLGTKQGIFSDFAAARHGCGNGGERASTLSQLSKDDKLKEHVPVNINYAWEALKKNSFMTGQKELSEIFMTLSGTKIIKVPANDDEPPKHRILDPKILDKNLISALLEGGEVEIYKCDEHDKCLNPKLKTITISSNDAFQHKVGKMLNDILGKINEDEPLNKNEIGLLNNVTVIPLYKILNVYSAYENSFALNDNAIFSEIIALNIIYKYLDDALKMVEKGSDFLDITDGDSYDKWEETIKASRTTILQRQNKGYARFNQTIAIIQNAQMIEKMLVGSLSNRLKDNLQWGR